jgi:glutamate carboxypeptidase
MNQYLLDLNIGKISKYLRDQKAAIESLIADLVLLESPSLDPTSQQPVFQILIARLGDLGMHTLMVKGKKTGGCLYARPSYRSKGQPIQLLLGHCDTVWPKGTLHEMPFNKSENRISGPGVYDMKSGICQMIFALQTIRALDIKLSVTPLILINSDEEIGSHESTTTISRLSMLSERIFVLEPPLGLEGKLKTARKGLGRFTIKIKGIPAHAGLDPDRGASAIVELSHQIQKLFAMNDAARGITVNVGMIEGGTAVNVIAPVSKAIVDVRVLTQEDAEEITQEIYNLKPVNPNTQIEVDGGIGRPPMEKTLRNQRLWGLAHAAGSKMGIQLEEGTAGGGSDGNTSSLFGATLDGLGIVGDGAHASHEFIFMDKFYERTLLLILLLSAKSIQMK